MQAAILILLLIVSTSEFFLMLLLRLVAPTSGSELFVILLDPTVVALISILSVSLLIRRGIIKLPERSVECAKWPTTTA
jgi:hypothetical protein